MLLHVCCAPDLVPAFFRLKASNSLKDVKLFFYNPNIHPENEYVKRYKEVEKLATQWNLEIVESDYEPDVFFDWVRGYEHLGENSRRCELCIYYRLVKTAEVAQKISEESFATTLTASPRKVLEKINKIGKIVEEKQGTKYISTTFRKGREYNLALSYVRENHIYRQKYCGCSYSLNEAIKLKETSQNRRREKLKNYGINGIELDPEEFYLDEKFYMEFLEKYSEIIALIRPRVVIVDSKLSRKLNLKKGWNKFSKFKTKVVIKER
ncbi:epoxyqueuosine reductase QueH [Thermosipho ferrireducens]|uniref:Epoxyqueuosine reductase QueH n=1 Tax=Thermosipho ferrireducens TaxID=2571116 RepID=A0ABX7SBG7_9BACT|nr:epoxyqueuosine reductase QueH [Thermosipho ferrireducens]QTA38745.1 epoxyqueuosine reductase QueH [Thermosipho ferrireducens]